MSFEYKRVDGVMVEIISISTIYPDYYQWGKNCANLGHTEEETRKVLTSYGHDFTAEQSDDFWRGYKDTKEQIKEPA